MADVSRVRQLLDELLDSQCTPEAVCDDRPELLPEVRRRWRQMCAVEAQLDALFPTPGERNPDARPLLHRMPASTCRDPTPHSHSHHHPTTTPSIPGYEVEALLGRWGIGIVYFFF